MKLKLFSVYGVISPPKFKLLFATLLLWIIAHFYTPIADFYKSTLPIHNSVSIFQMQCAPITWDIHSQCSMSLYGFIRCKMRYACNAIQHPCFPLSQSISIFCFQNSSFDMRHSCLSRCNVDTWRVCCGAEYDKAVIQSNILLWTWASRLSDLTLRWYAEQNA